jgi:hypothetical protein
MNLLPITFHVSLLQVDVAIRHLAGVAGVWVRGCTGCLDTRHDRKRKGCDLSLQIEVMRLVFLSLGLYPGLGVRDLQNDGCV